MNYSKGKYALTAMLIGLAVQACNLQTKQVYYINGDGSGKVDVVASLPYMHQKQNASPQELVILSGKKILKDSKGVDTWATLKIAPNKEDAKEKMDFSSVVYFKDLNQLKIPNITPAKMSFVKEKDQIEIVFGASYKKKHKKKIPENKLDEAVKKKLKDWASIKDMFTQMLSLSHLDISIVLPSSNATVENAVFDSKTKTVHIVIEGKKVAEAFEKANTDEKALREDLKNGTDEASMKIFYKELFGSEHPITIRIKGKTKDLFNYEAETRKAKKNFGPMVKKLKLSESKANSKQ